MFEDHQRREGESTQSRIWATRENEDATSYKPHKTGKQVSHAFAKELLVGIAGAEVDKLIESKGLDYIDRKKAKRHAQEIVENMYDQHYVIDQGADQYDPWVVFLCGKGLS